MLAVSHAPVTLENALLHYISGDGRAIRCIAVFSCKIVTLMHKIASYLDAIPRLFQNLSILQRCCWPSAVELTMALLMAYIQYGFMAPSRLFFIHRLLRSGVVTRIYLKDNESEVDVVVNSAPHCYDYCVVAFLNLKRGGPLPVLTDNVGLCHLQWIVWGSILRMPPKVCTKRFNVQEWLGYRVTGVTMEVPQEYVHCLC